MAWPATIQILKRARREGAVRTLHDRADRACDFIESSRTVFVARIQTNQRPPSSNLTTTRPWTGVEERRRIIFTEFLLQVLRGKAWKTPLVH